MRKKRNNNGFSLTEVLLAVGTLAIGMIFIGGTFVAGIHFSTIATERTVAVVAADEAFAKIKLFGVNFGDLTTNNQTIFGTGISADEFAYPSTITTTNKQYFWSALCRRVDVSGVLVTVFVSRKAGAGTKYRDPANPFNINAAIPYPKPVQVGVSGPGGSYELQITEAGKVNWINDGYTIVENTTGQIYRVIKRSTEQQDIIKLNSPWQGGNFVWVVPPPFGGGRKPCIAVYQTEISF